MPLVQRAPSQVPIRADTQRRPALFYVVLVAMGLVFVSRLFYLQVIRGDHYRSSALAEHQKKFEIPAKRGVIFAHDGDRMVPLVLNEARRLIYADPRYVKDKEGTARTLKEVLGGEEATYKSLLEKDDTAYVVLAKNVSQDVGNKLADKKLRGIGQTDTPSRVYPQGQLGAQMIGFVNGSGEGQYGIEEYFNKELSGKTGQLKAVTDINGVPLAAGDSSIQQAPKDGETINLTIDLNLQRYVEEALKNTTEQTKAKSASAVVIETSSGAIRAMGNYPTFDPNHYEDVGGDNYGVFSNRVSSTPYEAGSVMKVFTMTAALSEGVVSKDSTYTDTGSVKVEDRVIKNSRNWGNQSRSMSEILQLSLNTGVVHLLKQLGGGEVNKQAREKLHSYLVDRFHFDAATGVQLAGESGGTIPDVTTGNGDNVQYANMSFGQGMNVTMMQVATTLSAIVNGGTYYKPSVVEGQTSKAVAKGIVSSQTSEDLREMMRFVIKGTPFDRKGYYIGGKSGTAQLYDASGNYTNDKTTGSYLGFIGSKSPEYVIMVRVDEPDSSKGFSGTTAAAPLFSSINGYLIEYYAIPPGS